jgi:quercetin 2,3-dioxygenase
MIRVRRAADRGHANHGWLDTWHTFSFADYQDPEHMGFRTLRVINEDYVEPKKGFRPHGHRDMEILTYVLEGAVKHEDSMGNGSVIRAGEVQRMSAGTGVTHSEMNASDEEELHLLQIWILPEEQGLVPGYEQRAFSPEERTGRLRLVASQDGREGSVTIHQDVSVFATLLAEGERVEHSLGIDRGAWVQVARGEAHVNGQLLQEGDGAAVEGEPVCITGRRDAELLVFDLA